MTIEKVWLKSYPKGVPAEINAARFSSLVDMFDHSVEQYGNCPAVAGLGAKLNYRQLKKLSNQFAAFLQAQGLKKGDRVALMMPNIPQYLVALYGVLRAGLVIVNINPLYTEHELAKQVEDAGASAILVLANFANTLQQALPSITCLKHIIITEVADLAPFPKNTFINFIVKKVKKSVPEFQIKNFTTFAQALRQGRSFSLKPVELKHDDLAFLQYTGGTTGVSKGAMLSHGNMVANVEQAYHWMLPHFELGAERVAVALPLYHIFSLLANALVFMRAGSLNVMIPNPRDLNSVVDTFKKYNFTVFMGVNTLFNALLGKETFRELDLSKLHIIIAGGMALQKAISEKWYQITNTRIYEGYGLTETSPIVCINPLNDQPYNGSIGLPIPSTEIKILGEDGQELPMGEVGELCVRGPQVMQGYWRRPEETAKVMLPDGWLKTGDIAKLDENGFVYIVDRKKDMIDVAGFNVYPNEIEDVIAQHEKVREVAVIGVPHEVMGEVVKAYIVPSDETLTKSDVVAFCKERLVSYKVPKRIEFRQELPKNNVGKILRRILKEESEK